MLVLILLFGAKDAPRIFRSIHNALDKMQRAAAGFRYKIMYGDLYQDTDTSSEEPYDVEEEHAEQATEDEEQEADTSEEDSAATRHPAAPKSKDEGGPPPDTSV